MLLLIDAPDEAIFRLILPILVISSLLLLLTLSGCQPAVTPTDHYEHEQTGLADEMPPLSPVPLAEGEKLQVVATTTIVADVVKNVGGDLIDLTTLMPLGSDPHTFEPTPQDAAALANAHVIFINGAGLESLLEPLLESVGGPEKIVPLSYGIEFRRLEGKHGQADPHVWFDPHNVIVWTHNIEHALSVLDPHNAQTYAAHARAYETKLRDLDAWIREQVAQVPPSNRKLLTDHRVLGYFADRYGFEQIGTVIPGLSTLAQPSAQELTALEDAIRTHNAKAILVGTTVNPKLAQQIADDTDASLVFIYTGSLSEPNGPADSYLSLMRYDVSAIVEALK